jgi:hypothetical protein
MFTQIRLQAHAHSVSKLISQAFADWFCLCHSAVDYGVY